MDQPPAGHTQELRIENQGGFEGAHSDDLVERCGALGTLSVAAIRRASEENA